MAEDGGPPEHQWCPPDPGAASASGPQDGEPAAQSPDVESAPDFGPAPGFEQAPDFEQAPPFEGMPLAQQPDPAPRPSRRALILSGLAVAVVAVLVLVFGLGTGSTPAQSAAQTTSTSPDSSATASAIASPSATVASAAPRSAAQSVPASPSAPAGTPLPLAGTFPGSPGRAVVQAALSPGGGYLATVDDQSTTRVWNTATGAVISTLTGRPGLPAFGPDGTRFAAAAGTVQLYDSATGALIRTLNDAAADMFGPLAFSPDGRTVAVGSQARRTGPIRVFDTTTGRLVASIPAGAVVSALAFSPDGSTLLAGYSDGRLRAWNPVSGAAGTSFQTDLPPDETSDVGAESVSGDGKLLATSDSWGYQVAVWNTGDGTAAFHLTRAPLTASCDFVADAMAFSPDGTAFYIAGFNDDTVQEWDVAAGTESGLYTVGTPSADEVAAVYVTAQNTLLVLSVSGSTVRLWSGG